MSQWILRFFLLIFLFLFTISILLQFSYFQNIAADWVAKRLSSRLNVELTVDRVNFSFTKGFVLEGFLLKDENKDTLLFAHKLSSSLNKSLFSAFRNKFDIKSIDLEGGVVYLHYNPGDDRSKLEQILLGHPSTRKKRDINPPTPDIDIDIVNLTDIHIYIIDDRVGKSQKIFLEKAQFEIDEINLKEKVFALNRLYLFRPVVWLEDFDASNRSDGETEIARKDPVTTRDTSQSSLLISLCDLFVEEGTLYNHYKDSPEETAFRFTPEHFKLSSINLRIQDLEWIPDSVLTAYSFESDALLNNHFNIREVSFDSLLFGPATMDLNGFQLITDRSSIQNDIELVFSEFDQWENNLDQIGIQAELDNVGLSLYDLTYFIPSLKNSTIIQQNNGDIIRLRGTVYGKLDDLHGRNIDLAIGRSTRFRGDINTRNLGQRNNELLNVKVDQFQSSIRALRRLLPDFQPPENFDRLGSIQFSGRFDGYFRDFVVFGHVNTDIGEAELDMRMDVKHGMESANYSGYIDLIDFDLGQFSGDSDLGKISLTANVVNAKGLTLDHVTATLDATIHSLNYKGYGYNNVVMNGTIDKHQFSGDLVINDENVDFNFNGQVEFFDTTANYKFQADIRNLDFQAINLLERPLRIQGRLDIDMAGLELKEIEGDAVFKDLTISTDAKNYSLDSVLVRSEKLEGENMAFRIDSEIGSGSLKGIFDLREIPLIFGQILKKNYPFHTKNWNIPNPDSVLVEQDFEFELDITDTKNFLEIIGIKNLRIADTHLAGSVNNLQDKFEFHISSPLLAYDKYKMIRFDAYASSEKTKGLFNINIDSTYLDSKILKPIEIATTFSGDSIYYQVSTTEVMDSLEKISLSGYLVPNDKGYDIKVDNNELVMLGKNWDFHPDNKITLGPHYLNIDNLSISDGTRTILVDDINRNGVSIQFRRFDFHLANSLIQYDKMVFSGLSDGNIRIRNLFGNKEITGQLVVDDLMINDDPFGKMDLNMREVHDHLFDIKLAIERDTQTLYLEGIYDIEKNFVSASLDIMNYPMNIFEYIITDGISETKGVADIHAFIEGPISDLILKGDALVYGGGVRIDYLGTYYLLDRQPVFITQDYIDLSQTELTDLNGNTARMEGGLRHNFFADFRLDLNISSDRFISLNTNKFDNPFYYGFGQGEISVDFSGPFDAADIRVNAVTGENTQLSIPIRSTQYGFDESFIKFYQNDKPASELSFEDEFKLHGIDFEMNLELTEEAQVAIIFDDQVGEIMQGNGRGNISLFIKRFGDFDVYGSYEIIDGEYLFTAYGFVAKPFVISEGGTLSWSGDPFDAALNVVAEYKGLRAPLNVFLNEYLATAPPEVDQESRNRTDVDLKMILGGTLFNPIVNFDIAFPELTGELKSYADSKMRTLQATENGINNQVVGLLVFRNFLPYNNPMSNLTGNTILLTGSSTVTEFFTSQLSLLLSDVIQQQLSDDFFIQEIDVEIGLNENTNIFADNSQNLNLTPDEVNVNSRYRFKNDDFILNTGVNYVWESPIYAGNYLVGDIELEWFITDDRRLKFKFYGRYDYDEAFSSRKYKNGFGISFRKEFGTLSKFQQTVQKAMEDAERNSALLDQ